MKKFVFALPVLMFLTGCGPLFPALNLPKPPDIKYNIHETTSQKPIVGQTATGEVITFQNATEHVYDVNVERHDVPLTMWQKFCNWLSGFGILAILALVAGMVLAPGGTILFLYNKYSSWKKALTQTVAAIEETKVVDNSAPVKAALASNQDNDTKKLIDDIKRSI